MGKRGGVLGIGEEGEKGVISFGPTKGVDYCVDRTFKSDQKDARQKIFFSYIFWQKFTI